MRYTVTRQRVQVVGRLWMPSCLAATFRDLSAYDMGNLGDPSNRDDVASWIAMHMGDFSQIIDFRADFTIGDQNIVHEWESEESECTYGDCMSPDDE